MINEFVKPKHTSIKFEDLESEKDYAITINPQGSTPTKLQRAFNADASPLRQITTHFNAIAQCLKSARLCLCTESSPLARIHYHGVIQIVDLKDWLTELPLLMDIGTICIKPIEDSEVWNTYCLKQSKFWIDFFKDTKYAYPYHVPKPVRLPVEEQEEF